MKINLNNFNTQISIVALTMFLTTFILWVIAPKFFILAHFLTVGIFWISTLLFYLIIKNNINSKRTVNFVNMFMATTMAKLFALMVYIVVYVFTVRENLTQFLTFVLINYAIFTFFEVFFLLKSLKKNDKGMDTK
ncbi:MAG: hypothetical protein U9Q83_06290 [Bacteroidota bacterium]|nr:hypothetical protein [Bacteroidota bacterium]